MPAPHGMLRRSPTMRAAFLAFAVLLLAHQAYAAPTKVPLLRKGPYAIGKDFTRRGGARWQLQPAVRFDLAEMSGQLTCISGQPFTVTRDPALLVNCSSPRPVGCFP